MFFLLVASDLRAHWLDLGSWLFVAVELPFSCLLAADVFVVWAMDDAAASLEDAEGERAAETEDDAYAVHLHCFLELVLKRYLLLFLLFFFFCLDFL